MRYIMKATSLWHKDGEHYWEGYLTATSNVSGEWTWYTED